MRNAFVFCLFFFSFEAWPNLNVSWMSTAEFPMVLSVRVFPAITPRQKQILESGFTTFSQVSLTTKGGEKPIASKSCTARFDVWEDKIEFTVHGVDKEMRKLRSILEYSEACLQLIVPKNLLPQDAKELDLLLRFDQISDSQAEQIKKWIIENQSSVVDGLFRHMLGDLKLSEERKLLFSLP